MADEDVTVPENETSAAPYPAHWEADVVLRDGSTMRLRPVLPRDAHALQAMHRGQSESSVVFRFFAPRADLTEEELHRFTNVDHHNRVAFVFYSEGHLQGIGRFDATQDGEAEVAFYVSDALHGVGLGSVLLEHLAAAAREVGIHTFTAEVLPHNGKMLGVFRDAGFPIRARTEDGVIHVRMELEDTHAAWAVRAERERRAESVSMKRLLTPKRILLGECGPLRPHDALAMGRILANIENSPGAHEIVRADPRDLDPETTEPFEIAVLAGEPGEVVAAVPAATRLGVHGVLVPSTGFAECPRTQGSCGDGSTEVSDIDYFGVSSDSRRSEGARQQAKLLAATRAAGVRLIGPCSYGVLAVDGKGNVMNLLTAPENACCPQHTQEGGQGSAEAAIVPTSGVGLFGQSLESCHLLVARARERNIPIASILGSGNRADVSGNDTMQWWSVHEPTKVGVTSLETIGNPRKYARIARHLARSMPLVALVTDTVARNVIPGQDVRVSLYPPRVVDELMRQSGVIRTQTVTETLDLVAVLLTQPVPAGDRVAVVASSPGYAGLIAGLLDGAGFEVASAVSVDLAGGAEALTNALRASADTSDSIVVALSEALGDIAEDHTAAIVDAAEDDPRTWIVVDGMRAGIRDAYRKGDKVIPCLRATRGIVRTLSHLRDRRLWLERDDTGLLDLPDGVNLRAARSFVSAHRPKERGVDVVLDQAATVALLSTIGVPVLSTFEAASATEAAEYAAQILANGTEAHGIVLKLADPVLAARSALGGIRVSLHSTQSVVHAWQDLDATRRILGKENTPILVQAGAPAGVACRISAGEDPLYGPVVSLGLSGEASEILGDVSYRVAPLTKGDAQSMITGLGAARRLTGADGYPRANLEALGDLVARVAELVDEAPDVRQVLLDPVIAAPSGVAVAGARVVLRRAARQDTARRILAGNTPNNSHGGNRNR